jgi:hypothetical protein
MDTVLSVLVSLMRRKFKFVAAICFLFAVLLLWQDGFITTKVAIALVLSLVVGLFFLLVWLWSAVFQSINTGGDATTQEKR